MVGRSVEVGGVVNVKAMSSGSQDGDAIHKTQLGATKNLLLLGDWATVKDRYKHKHGTVTAAAICGHVFAH